MIETIDRKGDRILIGRDDDVTAYHAPTSSTLGVWDFAGRSGWTRDDRDFADFDGWRAHIDVLCAAARAHENTDAP